MTYREGVLELMSPSTPHEMWKTNIARFVEHFAFVRDIDLYAYGSTTFRAETVARGAEPDECYLVDHDLTDVPDIVLEIILTSPLLDKLDVYAGLRVPEVWLFRNGAFTIQVLDEATGRYRTVERSPRIPEIDLDVVARYAIRRDTPQALRECDALLRGG
jgi:Uma2 family endonuclease